MTIRKQVRSMVQDEFLHVQDTPALLIGSAAKTLYKKIQHEMSLTGKLQKEAKKVHKKATKKSKELTKKVAEQADEAGTMFGAGVLIDFSTMLGDVNSMLHKMGVLKSKGFDKYMLKIERKASGFARKAHADVLKDIKNNPLSATALAAGSPYVTVSNAASGAYKKAEQAYKKLAANNKSAASQINKANAKLDKI